MGIELHVRVDDAIDQLVSETVAARTAAKRAQVLTSDAVHRLRSRNVSVRDIAKILDITAGRVAQIDKGRAAARRRQAIPAAVRTIPPGQVLACRRKRDLIPSTVVSLDE